ncbi:MAG: hypothetical protein ACRD1Z_17225, partial [Vicinamibacteria bacterium]
MIPRSFGAFTVVVSSTLAAMGIAAFALGAPLPMLAIALVMGSVLVALFVLWRRSDRARAELESALLNERERARSALEQAWQNAFLGQV